MQVPVDDGRRVCVGQLPRRVEPSERARPPPQAQPLDLPQALPGHRDPEAHVPTAVRVGRQLVEQAGEVGAVQPAQERSQRSGKATTGGFGQAGVGDLPTGHEPATEEGPGKPLGGAPDEDWLGDRQRQERRQARQHGDLALHAGDRGGAPGEAEHPALVHQPDRVVPALGEQADRAERHSRNWPATSRPTRAASTASSALHSGTERKLVPRAAGRSHPMDEPPRGRVGRGSLFTGRRRAVRRPLTLPDP